MGKIVDVATNGGHAIQLTATGGDPYTDPVPIHWHAQVAELADALA
jgi:hypothetical protein